MNENKTFETNYHRLSSIQEEMYPIATAEKEEGGGINLDDEYLGTLCQEDIKILKRLRNTSVILLLLIIAAFSLYALLR